MKPAVLLPLCAASLALALAACEDKEPLKRTEAPAPSSPAEVAPVATPAPATAVEQKAPAVAGEAPAEPVTTTPEEQAPPPVGTEETAPASADAAEVGEVADRDSVDGDTSPYWEPPVASPPAAGLIEEARRAGWEVSRDNAGDVIMTPPAAETTR